MSMTSASKVAFDVRRHLGSKTAYANRLPIPDAPSVYATPDPKGYEAVHLYLLSRHGSRYPTAGRMQQINSLPSLFKDVTNTRDYPWVKEWKSPVANMSFAEGELHTVGESEMFNLGHRLRKRFAALLAKPYFPSRFQVVSTHVSRASASASAFMSGFFPVSVSDHTLSQTGMDPSDLPSLDQYDSGHSGSSSSSSSSSSRGDASKKRLRRQLRSSDLKQPVQERPRAASGRYSDSSGLFRTQACALKMSPKHADPLLRFFDMCPLYAQRDKYVGKWLKGWMLGNWTQLAMTVQSRLKLSRGMGPREVESLWQLCSMEATLHGSVDRACAIFTPEEHLLLEYLEDVKLVETQSYGSPLNFQIAAPLLQDLSQTLTAVAAGGDVSARLLFAHCETLVPVMTLLGLFKPELAPSAQPDSEEMSLITPIADAQQQLLQLDSIDDMGILASADLADPPPQASSVRSVRDTSTGFSISDSSSSSGSSGGSSSSGSTHSSSDADMTPTATTAVIGYSGGGSSSGGRDSSSDGGSGGGSSSRTEGGRQGAHGPSMAAGVHAPKPLPGFVPVPDGWRPMIEPGEGRLFKGSRVASFGANLGVVLYRRRGEAPSVGTHLVRLLYNEQIVQIPGCGKPLQGGSATGDVPECTLTEFLLLLGGKSRPSLDSLCAINSTDAS
ncbi:MAG: hypothetical protein WDW36_003972 [Sanguina aurantia]